MTEEDAWDLLVTVLSDLRVGGRAFPHVTASLYLDGFNVVRDLKQLLPVTADRTPNCYISRVAKATGCQPVLVIGGMQTSSWKLIDSLAPLIEETNQKHGNVSIDIGLVVGRLDRSIPYLDDGMGGNVCLTLNGTERIRDIERFDISDGRKQYYLARKNVIETANHSEEMAKTCSTWQVIRPEARTSGFPYDDLNSVLSEECRVAVQRGEYSNLGQAATVALVIEKVTNTKELIHQLQILHLCRWSAHGLGRTPPLKSGKVPIDALLSKKRHSRIVWASSNQALLLASWGHYFEVSSRPSWIDLFLRRLSEADSTRFDQLCTSVCVTDRLLAKELVDALWSANAVDFRVD